jgi:hypothetical protein
MSLRSTCSCAEICVFLICWTRTTQGSCGERVAFPKKASFRISWSGSCARRSRVQVRAKWNYLSFLERFSWELSRIVSFARPLLSFGTDLPSKIFPSWLCLESLLLQLLFECPRKKC